MGRKLLDLLGAPHAEAGADRQRGERTDAIEIAGDFGRQLPGTTGDACHGHGIDETAAGLAQPFEACRRRGGRDQLNQGETAGIQGCHEIRAFLDRQVGDDEATDAGGQRCLRQLAVTKIQQRVEITHQHDGRRVGPVGSKLRQNPAQTHARGDGRMAGPLDRHAIGHRIAERHADLDHVNFRRDDFQGGDEAIPGWIACRHVRHECGTTGSGRAANGRRDALVREFRLMRGHRAASSRIFFAPSKTCDSVGMSLSPRPDRPMRIFGVGRRLS